MVNEIHFVEYDSKEIENALIKAYEQAKGETLYPGDERRLFLLNLLPVIVGLKNSINDTGRQNLLRYARGEVLDALGEFYATTRLPAQKASVIIRFSLSAAQPVPVMIPAGTRVTPDGVLYFSTTQQLVIEPGQAEGHTQADAVETGARYNGLMPGQIKNIVDPVPYVASVVNIEESCGGAEIESDDSYRERIRQAPVSFSVAGPEGAYVYWAKTADSNISDVAIMSPSPGVVRIIPLLVEGSIPSQSILDKVEAACNAKTRRPLTDYVQVAAPTQVSYDIILTYYIPESRQVDEVHIKKAVEDPGGAIEQYIIWQKEKLGRAINPDELRYRIMQTRASRVVLSSPDYTVLGADEVAIPGTVSITYGGLE